MSEPEETVLTGGGRTTIHRSGDVVLREAGPWSTTVAALLAHLEQVGYPSAPRLAGRNGFWPDGREAVTFISGTSAHPGPWDDDTLLRLGQTLRALHAATADFQPPSDAHWQEWFGRDLGRAPRVIGHCDTGPWNIVVNAETVTLIDWESAGPVDPLVELAQMCWLNAQLHDDDIAARQHLGSPKERARHLRLIADGYELDRRSRGGLVITMIELAVADAAFEARAVEPDAEAGPLWDIAWRARAAAWMSRNRSTLEHALS